MLGTRLERARLAQPRTLTSVARVTDGTRDQACGVAAPRQEEVLKTVTLLCIWNRSGALQDVVRLAFVSTRLGKGVLLLSRSTGASKWEHCDALALDALCMTAAIPSQKQKKRCRALCRVLGTVPLPRSPTVRLQTVPQSGGLRLRCIKPLLFFGCGSSTSTTSSATPRLTIEPRRLSIHQTSHCCARCQS